MLKTTMDTIEGLDPSIAELYTEKDGKFVLTGIEGIKTEADVAALSSALAKERNDHKLIKAKYAPLATHDISDIVAKLDKFPELELAASGAVDEKKLGDLVSARLVPISREKAALEEKVKMLETTVGEYQQNEKSRKIIKAAKDAAKAAGVVPEALDYVAMYAEKMLTVDDTGSVVTKDNVGVTPYVDPKVWVTEMMPKQPLWQPKTAGGGATGSNSGANGAKNPWLAQTFNMTEQALLIKSNPRVAIQMAKAAGVDLVI
jgi:hypothetical protein